MKDSSHMYCAISDHPLIAWVRYAHAFCDAPPAPAITAGVVDLALRHRVIPSLHRALVSRGITPTINLDNYLALEARRHLLRKSVIGTLLDELQRKGLNALIYKGAALDDVYNGILRPAGDIDLLVEPADLDGVRKAADGIGAATTQMHAEQLSFSLEGVLVEIHTQLVERHIAILPHAASLFSRSIQCPHGSPGWRTLAPTDHLLALLVHGFKHQWCRLGWVVDIALLTRKMSGAELEVAEDLARAHNVGAVFTLGRDLAAQIMHGSHSDNSVARRYAHRLFQPGTSLGFKLENIALHLRVLEGYTARSRYIYTRGCSALSCAWKNPKNTLLKPPCRVSGD